MTDTRSHSGTAPPSIRDQRGLRIMLLSVAAAILLLGAVIAGVFGYLLISRGSAGAAASTLLG